VAQHAVPSRTHSLWLAGQHRPFPQIVPVQMHCPPWHTKFRLGISGSLGQVTPHMPQCSGLFWRSRQPEKQFAPPAGQRVCPAGHVCGVS
jgi:hypothetical protein